MISRLSMFFLLAASLHAKAGDTLVMHQLLQRITQLQAATNTVFPKGLFPSYRTYALNKDRQKADINIFFTGLIAFTLRDIESQLTPAQQQTAASIIANTLPVYDKFHNRKGRPTYNFWPTDTPMIFPNGGWLNRFDKGHALPDDLDDTAIMLLALAADTTTVQQAHLVMQEFTNNGRKKVKNTFKDYRQIGAYSTWFGKKMPVDFDVCVLTNVLYMVQTYQLPWTKADSASIYLITKVLQERKHISSAAYVAPHYNRLPVILYHLSRLMTASPIPALEAYRPQLIEDARQALEQSNNFIDKVILSTSLLRWGVAPPVVEIHKVTDLHALVEDESFSFFIANIASMLPDPLKQWIGEIGGGKFYYFCPAYNNLLVLEYLAWRKRMGLSLQ
ncbi:MAG: hypothetical protein NVSMB63_12130 [Sediminibacterium sp.]